MKSIQQLAILAITAALTAAAPLELRADSYPCTNGVFVLAAKGTGGYNDPNGVDPAYADLGADLQQVSDAIVSAAGQGSYGRALPYAASPGLNYFASIAHGTDVAQGIIKDYVNRCKTVGNMNPRIVLTGYSQGAEVVTSTLIGGQGRPNLDAYKQYITAGAIFADPSRVANVSPIDAGNATMSGTFPRTAADYAYYNTNYGNKLRSYCEAGDRYCANGGLLDQTALDIHHRSVAVYKGDAINFVSPKVK